MVNTDSTKRTTLITSLEDFGDLDQQGRAVFHGDRRFPERVFVEENWEYYFCDEFRGMSKQTLLKLARLYGDTNVSFSSREPSPLDFWFEAQEHFGAFSIPSSRIESDFDSLLDQYHGPLPQTLRIVSTLSWIWGTSLEWGIVVMSDFETGILGVSLDHPGTIVEAGFHTSDWLIGHLDSLRIALSDEKREILAQNYMRKNLSV